LSSTSEISGGALIFAAAFVDSFFKIISIFD
jgi:hypothetical protein